MFLFNYKYTINKSIIICKYILLYYVTEYFYYNTNSNNYFCLFLFE